MVDSQLVFTYSSVTSYYILLEPLHFLFPTKGQSCNYPTKIPPTPYRTESIYEKLHHKEMPLRKLLLRTRRPLNRPEAGPKPNNYAIVHAMMERYRPLLRETLLADGRIRTGIRTRTCRCTVGRIRFRIQRIPVILSMHLQLSDPALVIHKPQP